MRKPWTMRQVALLRKLYPHTLTAKLAERLDRPIRSVYQKALGMGLKKSAAFMASDASGRLTKLSAAGLNHRFKKGIPSWNLGKTGYMGANRTSFRKGDKPHTWLPVGSERVTSDGTIERKVADTGRKVRDWKPVKDILWEKLFGRIPRGRFVVHADRNRQNFTPSNLVLVNRAENMRRNTYHRYPKEIALAIQLRGALQRRINRMNREQHI